MKPFKRIKKSETSVSTFSIELNVQDIKNPLEENDCNENTEYSYRSCVENKMKGQYVIFFFV